ncbi:MAG: PspC domain-containing protein [Lentimicrobiaceae bacterium]|nr:PspC domain-containing protein [Lentimicrobiaceae bacterium]
MNQKRLTRSSTDRKIAGICGGLGEYFNVDPVLFRIAFCFALFMGGTGFILYIIMLLVVPEKQTRFQSSSKQDEEIIIEEISEEKKKDIKDATLLVLGALLILFGIFFFVVRAFPFHLREFFFPALLVIGGILLLIFSRKN